MRLFSTLTLLVAVAVLAYPTDFLFSQAAAGTAESGPKVIQTQDTNFSGIVAEIIEAKRKEGVLGVKVRFRNTSDQPVELYLYGSATRKGEIDKFYITGDSKKYFVLKDTEQEALASEELRAKLEKGQSHTWWAKFPAPPAEIKKFNLILPKVTPFEDIPITDAQ